jgi:hypothetical protein
MAAITFDTHQFIRTLKDAGIPENQAEAISDAFKEAQGQLNLVTKPDLEIAVKTLEVNLTRWIISAGVLQTALIAGLLIKLMK